MGPHSAEATDSRRFPLAKTKPLISLPGLLRAYFKIKTSGHLQIRASRSYTRQSLRYSRVYKHVIEEKPRPPHGVGYTEQRTASIQNKHNIKLESRRGRAIWQLGACMKRIEEDDATLACIPTRRRFSTTRIGSIDAWLLH